MVFQKLFKNEFAKNVIGLSFTTALSQVIPFLMLPILQRYFYSPDDFGVFSSFVAVSSVLIAFASFKYEFAIVLAKLRTEKIQLLLLSLFNTSFVCLLLLLVGAIFQQETSVLLKLPTGYFYILLLAASVFGYAGTQVFNYWQNHEKNYKGIGISKIIQSSGSESSKLVFGLLNFNAMGLIAGRVIGHSVGFIWLVFKIVPKIYDELKVNFKRQYLKAVFVKYKDFMLYSTPSSLLGTFSNNLHILIPMQFYSRDIVGLIGAAYIYLAVPAGIISGSFSQVFYQRISESNKRTDVMRLYVSFAKRLFFMAMPFAILLQFVPNSFASYLLGEEWSMIMVFAKIMVVYLVLMFVSSAVSFIYIRLQCQQKMLIIDIIRTLLNVAAIVLGHYLYNDPVITIIFFAGAQIISYLIAIFAAVYFIKTSKILS